jgi:hypothetical protein
MRAFDTEPWERIRERGRDRFLLRSIGRAAWICAVALGLVHLALALFGKRPMLPPWDLIAEWAALSVLSGAIFGRSQWEQSEAEYHGAKREDEKH